MRRDTSDPQPETAAVPPQLKPRALKVLGTEDADALRIEGQTLFNVNTLLPKAEAARKRREAAGISDRVEAAQPLDPPPFDTGLVGKQLGPGTLWRVEVNVPLGAYSGSCSSVERAPVCEFIVRVP